MYNHAHASGPRATASTSSQLYALFGDKYSTYKCKQRVHMLGVTIPQHPIAASHCIIQDQWFFDAWANAWGMFLDEVSIWVPPSSGITSNIIFMEQIAHYFSLVDWFSCWHLQFCSENWVRVTKVSTAPLSETDNRLLSKIVELAMPKQLREKLLPVSRPLKQHHPNLAKSYIIALYYSYFRNTLWSSL